MMIDSVHHNRIILKYFLCLVFFVCYLFPLQNTADEVSRKTEELTELQKKIKQISQKINNLSIEKKSLVFELKRLDKSYGKSALLLKTIKRQIQRQRIVLKENQQKIYAKQQQINAQKSAIESQIKMAYGMGRNYKLKFMLNLQDPVLSRRMMVYYDFLNQARLKKITRTNKDLKFLRALAETQEKERARLKQKLKKRKQENAVLLAIKAERQAVLVKLNKQFLSKKQLFNRFKASEKSLKSLLLLLQQTVTDAHSEGDLIQEFVKLKGKLPWPIKGRLIRKLTAQRSDSFGGGVLIKAKKGLDIRAIASGQIVYADWLRGYGLLTIINHGKGYMSLYAFNQSLFKTVGDWVGVGTVIGTVGQSGGQAEAGLYFGIRKNGQSVNPEKWCLKVRRGWVVN